MNPLISIIIPVYNAKDRIRNCLDTLVQQTLQDIEIICVLDCPLDGTDAVVESYAEKDGRIKIIENEKNLNIGESRNRGLQAATGQFIGFSDHDDYRKIDMYEKLYNRALETNATVVISGDLAKRIEKWMENNSNNIREYILYQLVMRHCTTHIHPILYRRDFLLENNVKFVDNNTHSVEDTLFNATVFANLIEKNLSIAYLPYEFYIHVDYDNNQNKSYSHWAFPKIVNSIKKIIELTNVHPIPDSCIAEFSIGCLYTSFLRELNKNGVIHALRVFRNLKSEKEIVRILLKNNGLWNSNFTVPKNVFSYFLKLIVSL